MKRNIEIVEISNPDFIYFYEGKEINVGKIEIFEDGRLIINDELIGGVLFTRSNITGVQLLSLLQKRFNEINNPVFMYNEKFMAGYALALFEAQNIVNAGEQYK